MRCRHASAQTRGLRQPDAWDAGRVGRSGIRIPGEIGPARGEPGGGVVGRPVRRGAARLRPDATTRSAGVAPRDACIASIAASTPSATVGLTPEGRWLAAVKACGPRGPGRSSLAMLFALMRRRRSSPEVTVVRRTAPRTRGRPRAPHPQPPPRGRAAPPWHPHHVAAAAAARSRRRAWRTGRSATLMSRAQSMRLTNLRSLARQLDRAPGRPGRARFARVLAHGRPRPARSSRTASSISSSPPGSRAPTSTSRCASTGAASSLTSAGRSTASSSRPTAPSGTTRRSRAPPTPSARRSSRPTASASSGSRGRRRRATSRQTLARVDAVRRP